MKPDTEELRYTVDDLIIDAEKQRVQRGEVVIPLSPLSFQMLLALVRAAPDLVSLDRLMKEVWPEVVVSAETVSQRIKLLRDALGDHADAPRYIAGVRGRGYRLVARVRPVVCACPPDPVPAVAAFPDPAVRAVPAARASSTRALAGAAAAVLIVAAALAALELFKAMHLPAAEPTPAAIASNTPAALPRLLVLPFENLGREEDGNFAAGMTDEISARLARIGDLSVIGRASALHFRDTNSSIQQIADALNVDYILDGSVRWEHLPDGSSRLRITPQLVRTADARQIWAEVYEEPLDGIFLLQAVIAERVVDALDLTVPEPEHRAMHVSPSENPEAYAYQLRGERDAPSLTTEDR